MEKKYTASSSNSLSFRGPRAYSMQICQICAIVILHSSALTNFDNVFLHYHEGPSLQGGPRSFNRNEHVRHPVVILLTYLLTLK